MPSDFGDESGEKLFDWMLKLGQQMGEEAMRSSAKALMQAFKNARGGITRADHLGSQVVRLRMDEFKALPAYDSIKEIIDKRLDKSAIEHNFAEIEGIEYLYFDSKNAPAVYAIFEELEECTETQLDRASKSLEQSREAKGRDEAKEGKHTASDRSHAAHEKEASAKKARPTDQEPLNERTERARASAQALAAEKGAEHEMKPLEVRSK